jgi:hypothetical protein
MKSYARRSNAGSLAALCVVLLAASCNGDDFGPAPEICDGSSNVRVGVQALVSLDRLGGGEQVLHDNGSAFFFMNGMCEYYLRWGGRFADVRTGTLDDPTAIAEGLQLAGVSARPGTYSGNVTDGATIKLFFDEDVVLCAGNCEGGSVPGWLTSMMSFTDQEFPDLYASSTAPDLPQQIVVVAHETGPLQPLLQWPAALDPASVAISEAEALELGFGDGTRISGTDGDALRALRRQLAGFVSVPVAGYIWYTREEQPPEYRLYLRDSIPWEDDRGLVPSPDQ